MRRDDMRVLMLTVIEQTAPDPPACFGTRAEWLEWLHMAHESGMSVVRRKDIGKSRHERQTWHEVKPLHEIAFCVDCTSIHRERMTASGRCARAMADAREAAETEIRMSVELQYEGIARAAHNIWRAYMMTGLKAPAGPAWDALTTKERNAIVVRTQEAHDALRQERDHGHEDRVFFEAVRYLLPVFQAVAHAKKHVEMVSQSSEEEQIGALLYIAAMVKRFGGETGTVSLTRDDMEAALDLELMRYDEEDGGLILKVEPKAKPLVQQHDPQIVSCGPGVVPLDLARAMNE